jgi:hypothetical protein
MSIQDIVLKIKSWMGKSYLRYFEQITAIFIITGCVVISAICGYFAGRITYIKKTTKKEPISIIYPPQPTISCDVYSAKKVTVKNLTHTQKTILEARSSSGSYAGSKTGKTYYPINCKGINRVKPENRVYFTTQEQARNAGYSLSKTCSPAK